MKFFVVSDIHSFFNLLQQELNKKGFDIDNPNHVLIVCGDLFDRGQESVALFEFIKDLNKKKRLIYIRGNHEDLLEDCLQELYNNRIPSQHHWSNGTVSTICQFCNIKYLDILDIRDIPTLSKNIESIMNPIVKFIDKNCINYYELGNYIFTHSWLPIEYDNLLHKYSANLNSSSDLWKRARWGNPFEMWEKGAYIPGKTVVCGHWHCSWGNAYLHNKYEEWPPKEDPDFLKAFEPFIDDGIIGIDACTAYSNKINVLIIEV